MYSGIGKVLSLDRKKDEILDNLRGVDLKPTQVLGKCGQVLQSPDSHTANSREEGGSGAGEIFSNAS